VGKGEGSGDESAEELLNEEERLRRREEKGKAAVNADDLIVIMARLSDRGGVDLKLTISKEDSVRLIIEKIKEEAGVSVSKAFAEIPH